MRMTPEVMVLGDHTMSRVSWTLKHETERIEAFAAESAEMADLMAKNGWSARMVAWGHLLNGWLDALGFDDEDGRT